MQRNEVASVEEMERVYLSLRNMLYGLNHKSAGNEGARRILRRNGLVLADQYTSFPDQFKRNHEFDVSSFMEKVRIGTAE